MAMGMGRMIQELSGYSDYNQLRKLADQKLAKVLFNKAKDTFAFVSEDGQVAKFTVEGDCCSHSWVEHVTVPKGCIGSPIKTLRDIPVSEDRDHPEFDCLQVYEMRLGTESGDEVVVEFRNSSNGYYGGYVVPCSDNSLDGMEEIKPE